MNPRRESSSDIGLNRAGAFERQFVEPSSHVFSAIESSFISRNKLPYVLTLLNP